MAASPNALSTSSLFGFGVNRLTTGTIIIPANIANAPQLIGDWSHVGKPALKKMLASISTELNKKHAQHDALETFLE